MKWFKHMTDSADDEKLAALLGAHGLEGYGLWWFMLEVVSKQIPKDGTKCFVAYPLSYWLRLTGIYHHVKLRKMLQSMHDLRLISAQCPNNVGTISDLSMKDVLTISIPNLLKFRDEYSRKSGVRPDIVSPKKEKEKEKEIKKETIPSSSADEVVAKPDFFETKKKKKLAGKRLDTFNQFWEAFDYKKGKADAADSWLCLPLLTDALVLKIIAGAKITAQQRFALKEAGTTPKMAQGWLSGRRWEDETSILLTPASPTLTPKQVADAANRKQKRELYGIE